MVFLNNCHFSNRHTNNFQLSIAGPPVIESGLTGLRVLKTTQSGFVNFVNDEYRKYYKEKVQLFRFLLFLQNNLINDRISAGCKRSGV